MRIKIAALVGVLAAAFMHNAAAVAIWDEGADGDLSSDPGAPTVVAVDIGSNSFAGSSGFGDMDLLTFEVPSGARLAQIVLTMYDSSSALAFLGIEAGSGITDITSPEHLLGWVHTSAAMLGTDVLDDAAQGPGAIGFTAPLGPGTYTLWVQETGSSPLSYAFDVVLIPGSTQLPEPTGGMLFTLGLGALFVARRRRA